MSQIPSNFVTASDEAGEKEKWFKRNRFILYFMIAFCLFFVVYQVFNYVGLSVSKDHETLTAAGQFGDSFGYVNALFSALAFAGVILALFVQIAEFHLAEQERSESIDIQSKTNCVQYFTSIVTAINTYASLHGKSELGDYRFLDSRTLLRIQNDRINAVVLDVATEYMVSESILSRGDKAIVEFQLDERCQLIRQIAPFIAALCGTVIFTFRDLLLQVTDQNNPHIVRSTDFIKEINRTLDEFERELESVIENYPQTPQTEHLILTLRRAIQFIRDEIQESGILETPQHVTGDIIDHILDVFHTSIDEEVEALLELLRHPNDFIFLLGKKAQ